MTADEAFARFAESISVVALPPYPPTDHFTTLHTLIADLRISTIFNGEGRIYRPLLCHICQAIDHPTNLCLFPHLPGWMGPTPETIGALEAASHEVLAGCPGKYGSSRRQDNAKENGGGKGKGKDRDDRKGGDRRK
ncbi:hypothetical protein C8R44DRAFT_892884 [Mycena epipterygia]|nr:hypothetical protein C8R44DRAFT_892884 [Mycena epipterygia]